MKQWLTLVSASLVAGVFSTSASAQCATDEDTVGVIVRRCMNAERTWVELTVDLTSPDLGVLVSRPSARGSSLSAWAADVPGSVIAVPAGDFGFDGFAPHGLTIGAGEQWTDTRDDAALSVLAFDVGAVPLFVPAEQEVVREPWMRHVLSGPAVLVDSVPQRCANAGCEIAPRTAVGISRDRRTLVMVSAAGFLPSALGVDDETLGELLREAGASHGIRVAMGAPSEVWGRGGAVMASSDGRSRSIAAHLAVIERGRGETFRLVGVAKETGDGGALLPDAQMRVETVDGELVVSSGTLTAGAYWEFELPVRDYIVRSTHPGYRSGCQYCRGEANVEVWCSVFLTPGSGASTCEPRPREIDGNTTWPRGTVPPPPTDAGVVVPQPEIESCAIGSTGGRRSPLAVVLLAFVALGLRRR